MRAYKAPTRVLAIDPGNVESGWVLIDNYIPMKFGKQRNMDLRSELLFGEIISEPEVTVVEMIASYGMAAGQTVHDTSRWVGRFQEAGVNVHLMFRKEVKLNLCGLTRAKDSNIRQALIDRFSYDRHKAKGGKGTKKDPGFFYGFSQDVWQAYALGVTYLDNPELCLPLET